MEKNDRVMQCNGFEYIDLGLPSGTMWATCNVGADSPYDGGLFFKRGDAIGYTEMHFLNCNTMFPKTVLDLADVVESYMGSGWKLPSQAQFYELYHNVTKSEVRYYKACLVIELYFTNGKSLILPFSGFAREIKGNICMINNSNRLFLWDDDVEPNSYVYLDDDLHIGFSQASSGAFLNMRCVIDNNKV